MADIDPLGNRPYKPQFYLSETSRQQWQKMFHNQLSDKEVHMMHDGFMKNCMSYMQQLWKQQIDHQKKLDEEQKKNR